MEPGALVASMLYYWVPEQRCAIQGVHKLPAGSWVPHQAGRQARGQVSTGVFRTWPPRRPASRRGPEDGDRGVGQGAPGRRRPGVELPVRRSRLQHHHGARPPGLERGGRLHDHLPAGRPEARGDAGRRRLRPQGRRRSSASTCTRSRYRRTSWTCCRAWSTSSTSRSATRRRSTRAHVRGGTRARGQGDPVGDGRRRAVRRVPKAPGLPDGQPLPPAARRRPRPRPARGEQPAGVHRRPRACATPAGPSGS